MATKKAPAKKTAAKAAPKHKATSVRTVRSTKQLESFKLARPQSPFLTIAITRQTLYWGIIAAAVLIMGLWIIHLQNKVNEIYDAIDAGNVSANSYSQPVKKPASKK